MLLGTYLFGILGPREELYMKDYFGRDYIEYTKRLVASWMPGRAELCCAHRFSYILA